MVTSNVRILLWHTPIGLTPMWRKSDILRLVHRIGRVLECPSGDNSVAEVFDCGSNLLHGQYRAINSESAPCLRATLFVHADHRAWWCDYRRDRLSAGPPPECHRFLSNW